MLQRSFRNASIRNKFRILVLGISAIAVAGSCTVFITYLWFSTRARLVERQETMATIVGDQSTAALEFDQPSQAAAILATLKAEQPIVAAAIYTRPGRLFASYLREGISPSILPALPGPDGQRFQDGDLLDFHPIQSGGDRVGTLLMRSDLSELRDRVYFVIGTAVLVLIGASFTVLLLSTKLGGLVTGPVLRLAEVAQAVSQRKDYSIRVKAGGEDEMGRLIEGFNEMLAQIQARDGALAAARDDLEKRVLERTRELEQEVGERKAAEDRLHEKDARLIEAQEIARLGSWEWNIASNTVSWSDEVYRLSGIMPSKFGGGFSDFVNVAHPDDRTPLREALETACRKREPLTLDFRIIRPDGSVRHLHAQGKVVLDAEGRPLRLVATLQDITERKLADQAIQDLNRELQTRMAELASANKELEGFSYSVSHDLRAPLRAIDGFSRMLVEDFGDQAKGDVRRYLDVIVGNTRRMGQLIDDLLSFARMGRKSLETSTIDMDAMVKDVVADLSQQNPDRALEFRVGFLPPAQGDTAMFRQVWTNLISNAVKYSRGRAPAQVEIQARKAEHEIVYSVRDNGVGFDMQYSHKLFGVFQRLHSDKEFEGTGVGLALVARIVQRHGGRVWADGKLGDGATFSFALPATRTNGDRSAE
ncbi:MAG TPA: ATP-binding protein [Planctomycetota bacterium]|nr:ATP-binding protein [Planctomycetota bacterium]